MYRQNLPGSEFIFWTRDENELFIRNVSCVMPNKTEPKYNNMQANLDLYVLGDYASIF